MSIERQEIVDIYKAWSQRALRKCLKPQSVDDPIWRDVEDCVNRIIEEITVFAEEQVRSEMD